MVAAIYVASNHNTWNLTLEYDVEYAITVTSINCAGESDPVLNQLEDQMFSKSYTNLQDNFSLQIFIYHNAYMPTVLVGPQIEAESYCMYANSNKSKHKYWLIF